MEGSPLNHECQYPRRESAIGLADWIDAESRFLASVARVEVPRQVIVEVHPNHDAEEATDFGHG
jgi:hypothetical protein